MGGSAEGQAWSRRGPPSVPAEIDYEKNVSSHPPQGLLLVPSKLNFQVKLLVMLAREGFPRLPTFSLKQVI